MKKILPVVIALLLAAVCFSAAADEEAQDIKLTIEDGRLWVRIADDPSEAVAWEAMSPEEEDRVVELLPVDPMVAAPVFLYAPVRDGFTIVDISHTVDFVTDEVYSLLIEVEGGSIVGVDYEYYASPADEFIELFLVGEWLEKAAGETALSIGDNEGSGWNVTINGPLAQGAYQFTGTVRYDCDLEALVYINGAMYSLPVTDGTEQAEPEPLQENMTGFMFLDISNEQDGQLLMVWENPVTSDFLEFRRTDKDAPDVIAPEVLDVAIEDGILEDGFYWANFYPSALEEGSEDGVSFCAVDVYTGEDVRQVSPGDMLYRNYVMYMVSGMDENGTMAYVDTSTGETGAISFLPIPGFDAYVALDAADGYSLMLTAAEFTRMPLSKDVKLYTVSGENLETAEVDADTLGAALDPGETVSFAIILDGAIVEIRTYKDAPVGEMMADILSAAVEPEK